MIGFLHALLKVIKDLEAAVDRVLVKVDAVKQGILDAIEAFKQLKELMEGDDASGAELAAKIRGITQQVSSEDEALKDVLNNPNNPTNEGDPQ